MSYRGDNESEFIDDDDYFDPDDSGGPRRSNVLGGSGSRRDSEADDYPPEDRPAATGRAQSARGQPHKQAKRAAAKARRPKATERNPAPSVASSEERRARLAGKKPGAKERSPQRQARDEDPPPPSEARPRESRLGGLRARFGRADKQTVSKSDGDASRLSAFAGGIGGRIGSLSGRLGRARNNDDPAADGLDVDAGGHAQGGRLSSRANDRSSAGFAARASRDQERPPGDSPSSRAPKIKAAGWLDLDRKLDLIGVALVFGAIVVVFSALSTERAAISSVNTIIGQLLGWGAFAVPVTMFAIGLWLIVRHFGDEAPVIDPVRLSGVVLAFLSILALFQFIDSFGYEAAIPRIESCRNPVDPACVDALVQQSYQAGRGGGVIGGWFYSALVNNLTEAGGFVIMLMLMTISAMMTTRSSMAELTIVAIGVGRSLRTKLSHYASTRRAARLKARPASLATPASHVRVSKPRAPQLARGAQDARALPEPSAATMPVLQRFRGVLGLRGRLSAPAAREPLPLKDGAAPAETSPNQGAIGRLFRRTSAREVGASSPPAQLEPTAGALERFLNLGDDLPFSTEESPVWQKPSRPGSAQPPLAPPQPRNDKTDYQPAPAMPDNHRPEQPDQPAPDIIARAEPAPHPPDQAAAEPPAAASETTTPDETADRVPIDPPEAEATAPDNGTAADRSAPNSPRDNGAASETLIMPSRKAKKKNAIRSLSTPRPRINWQLPDHRDLLNSGAEGELDREPLLRQAQVIEETLASFGAPGRIVEINSGPVITQYGVEPAYLTAKSGKQNRVKVGAIAKLDKDLQLALGARSIRVEAPVPGKGYVGIEVPNPASARVSLRDVMESASYQKIESPLAIALGVSVDGTPISGDLTQMPHLLIAGATGAGKSVCINAILNSLIANNSPDVVKFIMIDPKRVELTGYNGLPHLVAPVVVELERTIGVLRWVTSEMDARYKKFSQAGARNIVDYNSILDPDLAPMPYIVVIIDELADLMMMAPDDTERAITRIAALARATGIHLVIATQRPSVDVVTGLIKANCPARIAFAVAGSVDSRVILDQPGAERLLGKGDMLYLSGNSPAPLRMQGVHVSNEEINRIIQYWKMQAAGIDSIEPISLRAMPPADGAGESAEDADRALADQGGAQAGFWDMTPGKRKTSDGAVGSADSDEDEYYQTAVDMVRRLEKASISLLQRRLRIGYTRAARLMDMMEERGVVGPPKEGSSKPRDVLPK